VLWFFVLAYVITGVGMCVDSLAFRRLPDGAPISSQTLPWLRYAPYVLWAGPYLASLLMTLFQYGLRGVGRLASRLSPWSVGPAWPVPVVCLLLPLGVVVLPVRILAALGVAVPTVHWGGWSDYVYTAVIGAGLIGPGLFEEIGWRGFALPHLQRRYSALVSKVANRRQIRDWAWTDCHGRSAPEGAHGRRQASDASGSLWCDAW